jgi:hypothetical protein
MRKRLSQSFAYLFRRLVCQTPNYLDSTLPLIEPLWSPDL